MSAPKLWWAAAGFPDNHNYVLVPGVGTTAQGGVAQLCHLCGEVEPPLRVSTRDERTDRAAMHLVHGVRFHLNATTEEWSRP